jgi:Uma2 family endonuclease
MTSIAETAEDIVDAEPEAQQFVFDDADWEFYELLLKRMQDRHVFVTFDGERLEVMSPSPEHELTAERIALFVRLVLSEQNRPHIGMGSPTLRRRRAKRGLEPDRCFYIQNVQAVIGKKKIDLRKDPAPDLAIEVEISRRLLDRIDIYRRLGVPEVWCYDGRRLRFLRLEGADYQEVPLSPTFAGLAPADVHRLVEQGWGAEELAWTAAARSWVREHLPAPKAPDQ